MMQSEKRTGATKNEMLKFLNLAAERVGALITVATATKRDIKDREQTLT